MNVAPRMARLGTESAFEVLARARQLERAGREIIHLEIGEPDFDTPAHIKEAAKQALDAGATHYGPAAGLPELREAIAKHVAETRGIAVAPEEVVVTPGAKPIMFFTIMAMIGEGDEVIHPNPGFPIYESVINFVGGVPVPIPLREESGFGFDLDLFERRVSSKTKLIVINSPENPTGGVLDRAQLERIAAIQGDQTPVARMVAEFKRRRDLFVDGLNQLPGVKCARPRGAFYVFPNITGTRRSSAEVAERLLNDAGVAALSGAAFGAHGEGYLRFSYANSEANLRRALERMRPVFERFAN